MRVDKWLWSVRLYKTRNQASHDCSTGKVKRSGKTLKPSAALKIGDTLEVPSSDNTYKRNIEVIQLIEKRVGAPLAREAYHDHTPAKILAEAEHSQSRKEGDQGRLTKRNRRQWEEGANRFF